MSMLQGPKYEFVKIDQQCLIHDSSKSYHHYNFTMKKKSSFYLGKREERDLGIISSSLLKSNPQRKENNSFAGHCSMVRMV